MFIEKAKRITFSKEKWDKNMFEKLKMTFTINVCTGKIYIQFFILRT